MLRYEKELYSQRGFRAGAGVIKGWTDEVPADQ